MDYLYHVAMLEEAKKDYICKLMSAVLIGNAHVARNISMLEYITSGDVQS